MKTVGKMGRHPSVIFKSCIKAIANHKNFPETLGAAMTKESNTSATTILFSKRSMTARVDFGKRRANQTLENRQAGD